jgi:hypothetical protein
MIGLVVVTAAVVVAALVAVAAVVFAAYTICLQCPLCSHFRRAWVVA